MTFYIKLTKKDDQRVLQLCKSIFYVRSLDPVKDEHDPSFFAMYFTSSYTSLYQFRLT